MGSEHLPAGEPRTGDPPSLALRSPRLRHAALRGADSGAPSAGQEGLALRQPPRRAGPLASARLDRGVPSPRAANPRPRDCRPALLPPRGRRGGDGAGSRPLADSLPLTFSSTPALAGAGAAMVPWSPHSCGPSAWRPRTGQRWEEEGSAL